MNFLAHAYLSFKHPEVLVGNMISDFVKGKKKLDYPLGIQKGIALHRQIDDFTDHHPAVKTAARFFQSDYHRYAPAFIDIVFDYFLAHDEKFFPEESDLERFAAETYNRIDNFSRILPPPFSAMFPHMKSRNWLLNYRQDWGIHNALNGLVSRAAYLSDAEPAFATFLREKDALAACYQNFFPQLLDFAVQQYETMLKAD